MQVWETIQADPFKDDLRASYKMSTAKVLLFIQKRNASSDSDDVISIFEIPEYAEMFRIVFKPGEYKDRRNQFYMSRRLLQDYISDTLKSLYADSDPFEYVQVSTAQHPSVLYHISDLENRETRHMIEDMVMAAVCTPTKFLKTPRKE